MRSLRRPILALLSITSLFACGPISGESMTDTTDESTGDASTSEPTGSTTSDPTSATSSTGSTSTAGSTGEGSSGTTIAPDPDYVRECQPNDFKCDDWGCERKPVVKPGECYKRCTPDVVGEQSSGCDEPERPFCSQVGVSDGGDHHCNDCAFVCVAEAFNQCEENMNFCQA